MEQYFFPNGSHASLKGNNNFYGDVKKKAEFGKEHSILLFLDRNVGSFVYNSNSNNNNNNKEIYFTSNLTVYINIK